MEAQQSSLVQALPCLAPTTWPVCLPFFPLTTERCCLALPFAVVHPLMSTTVMMSGFSSWELANYECSLARSQHRFMHHSCQVRRDDACARGLPLDGGERRVRWWGHRWQMQLCSDKLEFSYSLASQSTVLLPMGPCAGYTAVQHHLPMLLTKCCTCCIPGSYQMLHAPHWTTAWPNS